MYVPEEAKIDKRPSLKESWWNYEMLDKKCNFVLCLPMFASDMLVRMQNFKEIWRPIFKIY